MKLGERLVLPLAGDGRHPDGVLGCTVTRPWAGTMADLSAVTAGPPEITFLPLPR